MNKMKKDRKMCDLMLALMILQLMIVGGKLSG